MIVCDPGNCDISSHGWKCTVKKRNKNRITCAVWGSSILATVEFLFLFSLMNVSFVWLWPADATAAALGDSKRNLPRCGGWLY